MIDDKKRLNGNGTEQLWNAMIEYIDEIIELNENNFSSIDGTVMYIRAGEGLNGGLISSSGIISLKPATDITWGGLYINLIENKINICDIFTIK